MKPIVMYVDDSQNNLIGFEARFEETLDVRTFNDPLEALKELSSINPALIISDQKMPKMTGAKFLASTIPLRPDAVRIIITGYSEVELLLESIRFARVQDYIRKPCSDEELVERIEAGLALYNEIQDRWNKR